MPKDNNREDKHNNTLAEDEDFIKFKELYEDIENIEITQVRKLFSLKIKDLHKKSNIQQLSRKQQKLLSTILSFVRTL